MVCTHSLGLFNQELDVNSVLMGHERGGKSLITHCQSTFQDLICLMSYFLSFLLGFLFFFPHVLSSFVALPWSVSCVSPHLPFLIARSSLPCEINTFCFKWLKCPPTEMARFWKRSSGWASQKIYFVYIKKYIKNIQKTFTIIFEYKDIIERKKEIS